MAGHDVSYVAAPGSPSDGRNEALVISPSSVDPDQEYDPFSIATVLRHFKGIFYQARGKNFYATALFDVCKELFKKDYEVTCVPNPGGALCVHYPYELIVPVRDLHDAAAPASPLAGRSAADLGRLMAQSRVARCRARFVAPCLLYRGRHVCRSVTLAVRAETFARVGIDMVASGLESVAASSASSTGGTSGSPPVVYTPSADKVQGIYCPKNRRAAPDGCGTSGETEPPVPRSLLQQARAADADLLRQCRVTTICNLMLETQRPFLGFCVASSEGYSELYDEYKRLDLPYPGADFFVEFVRHGSSARGLRFPWDRPAHDARVKATSSVLNFAKLNLGIDLDQYREWDVADLTANYLHLLVRLVVEEDGPPGLLVHCISGWDRTPLFIALLRLCLWADGLAHQSLTPHQILLLTLGYDWLLFGHQFYTRLLGHEEILYFCYSFLRHFAHARYSLGLVVPYEERARRLAAVRELFLEAYHEAVGPRPLREPPQHPPGHGILTAARGGFNYVKQQITGGRF